MDISNKQIMALRDEAGEHGDLEQVRICEEALGLRDVGADRRGEARAECEAVIAAALAQQSE